MKLAVAGCMGRMGLTLLEAIDADQESTLIGGTVRGERRGDAIDFLVRRGYEHISLTDDLDELADEADAIVDFTNPSYSLEVARACAERNAAHICGTTSFDGEAFAALEKYAAKTPIIWASNFSIGVNLLMSLTERVAGTLGEEFDIEIVEMHHKHKVDAPSGTALSLGRAAASGRGVALDDVAARGRDGITGGRDKGAIGFASLRGGDVIGDHSVMFAGPGERVELTHKASSREIYAHGAIRAAHWACEQESGYYSMQDVLGL